MIVGYQACDGSQFLELLDKSLSETKGGFSITLLGWQDGDYFRRLCEEDGGVIPDHYAFFKKFPVGLVLKSKQELMKQVTEAIAKPYLSSRNGNYRYQYDIHIWAGRYYFVYNGFVKRLLIVERGWLSRILGTVAKPDWQVM